MSSAGRSKPKIDLEVTLMQEDNWKTWDNIVDSSIEGLIYHSSIWLRIVHLSNPQKFEPTHLVGIDRKGEIKAVFPMFIDHRFLVEDARSIPYCSTGGICRKTDTASQISITPFLSYLDEVAIRRHLFSIKIYSSFLADSDDYEYGYIAKEYTINRDFQQFLLPIDKGEKVIWRELGKKVRNSIRKSWKLGVETFQARTLKDLKEYYRIYSKTATRKGFTPKPFSIFRSLWERLYPDNVRVFLASLDDQVISGTVLLCHKGVLHYWNAASEEGFLGFNANDLLLYDSIRWGSKNGIRIFDLGCSTRSQRGVYMFKKKWGKTIVPLLHKTKEHPARGFLGRFRYFANSGARLVRKQVRSSIQLGQIF